MAQNSINFATPQPVTNRTLVVMIDTARAAFAGSATDEGIELLLQNLPACLEELLDYRKRAAEALEIEPDLSNVVDLRRQ